MTLLLVAPSTTIVEANGNKNASTDECYENKKCCINIDNISKVITDVFIACMLPTKDEFETSAIYDKKVMFAKKEKDKYINKYYLFKIDKDSVWLKYNADVENLEFGINDSANCTSQMYNRQNENSVFVIDIEKEKSDREYVGENSFGVKRTITEHTRSTKSIYLSNFSLLRKFSHTGEFGNIRLSVFSKKYTVEDAKEIKKRIDMFVLVKPESVGREDMVCPSYVHGEEKHGYTWKCSYSSKPTIDLPIANIGHYYQLNASLAAVITIDRETNKIINCTFYDKHHPDISSHFLTN